MYVYDAYNQIMGTMFFYNSDYTYNAGHTVSVENWFQFCPYYPVTPAYSFYHTGLDVYVHKAWLTRSSTKSATTASRGSICKNPKKLCLGIRSKQEHDVPHAACCMLHAACCMRHAACDSSAGLLLLKQLHWLPVVGRIKLKLANVKYRTLSTQQPT